MFALSFPRLDIMTRPWEDIFDTWSDLPLYRDVAFEDWLPSSNIVETDKHFVITMEVPGIDMGKTDISYKENLLTVKGEKLIDAEDGESCVRAERFSGSFERNFRLVGKIDEDKIDATFKDGILKVVLPKSESSLVKKIQIH
jgi:HSP20 family protein